MNVGSIHLGRDVLVGRHVTLSVGYSPGAPGAPGAPERGLVIGNRRVIGTRSSLTAHTLIELGDDVWFGQDVFVCDASHGYQDPTPHRAPARRAPAGPHRLRHLDRPRRRRPPRHDHRPQRRRRRLRRAR